jgi:hypothetical protein
VSYPGNSYPGRPAAAGARRPGRRPAAVVGAVVVLGLMAAVGLAHAVAVLASLDGIVARFRSAAVRTGADPSDIDTGVGLLRGGIILATVLAILVAVLLVLLALGNWRGGRNARVATWVVCVLGLLCGCWGLAAIIVQRVVAWPGAGDGQAAGNLVREVAGAYPSWWIAVSAGLSAAQALGYLVVAVLLALPAANDLFRRAPAAPGWSSAGTPAAPPIPPM